jgi:DNA-binding MarR family transcriptional regulator
MPAETDRSSNMYPEVDRLIHEPSRYNIMVLLYVVDRAEYLFVLNQTGMTSGNLTAHTSKLEEAGYVSVRKKFIRKKPKTFLSLTPRGRRAFEQYRSTMKQHFDTPPGGDINTPETNGERRIGT